MKRSGFILSSLIEQIISAQLGPRRLNHTFTSDEYCGVDVLDLVST